MTRNSYQSGPTCPVSSALPPMPEHTTRQTSLERLEEAVAKLTQHQATIAQDHHTLTQTNLDLSLKIDSLLDRLAAFTTNPPSPKPPPSPPPISSFRPHMKLEVPRFDGGPPCLDLQNPAVL
ncbi:hypothetical protein HKD37_12G034685 [Glycine soja]